jgi:hypothetical protein
MSMSTPVNSAGDLVVLLVADRAEQGRRRDLALAVDLDPQLVLVVRLELEPGAAVRDDLGREQHPARGGILGLAVVHARRATSWLTTTRSAPLITNVPWSVIHG